jgi:hypothetical protein
VAGDKHGQYRAQTDLVETVEVGSKDGVDQENASRMDGRMGEGEMGTNDIQFDPHTDSKNTTTAQLSTQSTEFDNHPDAY